MSRPPLDANDGGGRFPGFDVLSQRKHWDDITTAVVVGRLGMPSDIRFFTPAEEAAARALFDQLLDQRADPRVPVVNMVDGRLAEQETDGWHYEGMADDGQAWRDSLAALDADTRKAHGCSFAEASWDQQQRLLNTIHGLDRQQWHGVPARRIWSLWTRYACTAFYSHPWAWDEIGFAGPAYPRGYKNLGIDRLEPFEVPDARPGLDPARVDSDPKNQPQGGSGGGGPDESGGRQSDTGGHGPSGGGSGKQS